MKPLIAVKDKEGNVYTMPSNTNKSITEIHYSTSYYRFIVQDVITGEDGELLCPEKTIIVPINKNKWVDFLAVKENEIGELVEERSNITQYIPHGVASPIVYHDGRYQNVDRYRRKIRGRCTEMENLGAGGMMLTILKGFAVITVLTLFSLLLIKMFSAKVLVGLFIILLLLVLCYFLGLVVEDILD